MKHILGSLLVSGAMLMMTTAVLPLAANAAESQNGTTDVTATFKAGDDAVNPVDPTDPTTPGDDGNNSATPGSGLSLIYVTNAIDFGTNAVDVVNDQKYTASGGDTSTLWNGKAVAEVSDARGTNAGWNLSVSGSAFSNGEGENKTILKGATLTYGTADLSNTGKDNNGAKAFAVTDVTNNSATVMSADEGSGAGITIAQFDPANISLNVLANTAKSLAYKTTLTWTLSALPAD